FYQNFGTEMIGAVVTFALFQVFTGRLTEIQTMIIEMRSRDNATAITATERIRARYLHTGTLLEGKDFTGANLYGVELNGSNLSGANFTDTNLESANLENCRLSKVNLS